MISRSIWSYLFTFYSLVKSENYGWHAFRGGTFSQRMVNCKFIPWQCFSLQIYPAANASIIFHCICRRTTSSLNKEALHFSSLSESSELKLPDASLLFDSPTMPGHLGHNTDHSSRVAAAMAENATRKRDINVSVSTYPHSKIPKGNLPHMKNVPETGGGLLLPPQLSGRSVICWNFEFCCMLCINFVYLCKSYRASLSVLLFVLIMFCQILLKLNFHFSYWVVCV